MICETCGKEKDENTLLCTNCGTQCECGGSCNSHIKKEKKKNNIIKNMKNMFRKGYSTE